MSKVKYQEFTGRMVSYDRLNNSYYGNPAFHAIFVNEAGEVLEGRTTPNASCAYGFLNSERSPRKVRYHVTPSGTVRFDYVDPIREA